MSTATEKPKSVKMGRIRISNQRSLGTVPRNKNFVDLKIQINRTERALPFFNVVNTNYRVWSGKKKLPSEIYIRIHERIFQTRILKRSVKQRSETRVFKDVTSGHVRVMINRHKADRFESNVYVCIPVEHYPHGSKVEFIMMMTLYEFLNAVKAGIMYDDQIDKTTFWRNALD